MSKGIVWQPTPSSATLKTTFIDYKTWHDFMTDMGLDEITYRLDQTTYNILMWFGASTYLKHPNINQNRIECFFQWKSIIDLQTVLEPLYAKDLETLFTNMSIGKAYSPSGDQTDEAITQKDYLSSKATTEQSVNVIDQVMILQKIWFGGFSKDDFLYKRFMQMVSSDFQPRLDFDYNASQN